MSIIFDFIIMPIVILTGMIIWIVVAVIFAQVLFMIARRKFNEMSKLWRR